MNAPLFLCLAVACGFMALVMFGSACTPLVPPLKYEHVRFRILVAFGSLCLALSAILLLLLIAYVITG